MLSEENRASQNNSMTPEIIEGIESVIKDLRRAADYVFGARVHIKEIRSGDFIRGCDGVEVSAETHEGLRLALEELLREAHKTAHESGFGG